jgi:uncharacterized protein YaiI (UPF0178 family)
MKILVDADSCPPAARELVLRAAARTGIRAVFAANRPIPGIDGEYAAMAICSAGEGAADDQLAALAQPGDLALTRDIPLAARLLEAGAEVLDDRGRIFTAENIREKLSMRNFTVGLAENGYEVLPFPAPRQVSSDASGRWVVDGGSAYYVCNGILWRLDLADDTKVPLADWHCKEAVGVAGGKVYFVTDTLERINPDGSGRETVVRQ